MKEKKLFKELSIYNVPIDKPKIKKRTNVEMLSEIQFYDKLNIVQTVSAFKKNARSYNTEIIKDNDGNMNDLLVQLQASKPVIKDLFRDFLIEMKVFKYQTTLSFIKQTKTKWRHKIFNCLF